MKLNEIKIGGLDCIEIPGDASKGTIVLLHGYGATNRDLTPLSRVCPDARWIFPAGPNKIEYGADYTGYAWFPVDVYGLQQAVGNKDFERVTQALSSDLVEASSKFQLFLKELDTASDKLVLGGFSQGAVIATDCALSLDTNPAGLVILSGTLAHEKRWTECASKHKELPFFMSHGRHDEILPVELAAKLEKLLLAGGLKGKLHTFNAGHEVPFSVLLDLQPFLSSIIR